MLKIIKYKLITQIYLQSIEPTRIICRRIAGHIEHFIHYVMLFRFCWGLPIIAATLKTVPSLACITLIKAMHTSKKATAT